MRCVRACHARGWECNSSRPWNSPNLKVEGAVHTILLSPEDASQVLRPVGMGVCGKGRSLQQVEGELCTSNNSGDLHVGSPFSI